MTTNELNKKKKEDYKVDDRICIFYVTDRVHDLEKIKDIQAGWHDGVERVFSDVTPVSLALTQKGQLTGWGCGGDASQGRVTKTMFKNAKTQKNTQGIFSLEAAESISTSDWIWMLVTHWCCKYIPQRRSRNTAGPSHLLPPQP